MKGIDDIRDIIVKLKGKKKFRNVDFDKLQLMINSAEREAPALDSADGLARIRRTIASGKRPRTAPGLFTRRALVPACAALFLIFLAGIFIYSLLERDDQRFYCTLTSGTVSILRDGERIPCTRGSSLLANDIIETDENASADFSYRDTVTFRIKEHAKILISELHRSDDRMILDMDLSRGIMLITLSKLSRKDEAVIRTPISVAVVRGTSFGVSVDKDLNSRYEVADGKIRIANRLSIDKERIRRAEQEDFLNSLESMVEMNSITVEENSICMLRSSHYYRFKNTVDSLMAAIEQSKTPVSAAELSRIAELLAKPEIHSATPQNALMIPELNQFTSAISREDREHLQLTIHAQPENAVITLDGSRITSETVSVSRGIHRLVVTAEGFIPRTLSVPVADSDVEISVDLKRAGQPHGQDEWAAQIDANYVIALPRRDMFLSFRKNGTVIAFTKEAVLWKQHLPGAINSPPVVDAESLYIATDDQRLSSLSLKDGTLQWSNAIRGIIHFNSGLMKYRNSIYAATTRGYLHRFTGRGKLLWIVKLPAGIYTKPVQSDKFLFVSTSDDHIYGIDVNLRIMVFKVKVGKVIGSTINIRDKNLYISNYNGEVLCYNYERDEIVWRHHSGSRIIVDSSLHGNNLYISNVNGDISKLDLSGNLQWKISLGNTITKTPLVDGHTVYVLTQKVLYLVDTESGGIKWSYVIPDKVTTNIALSHKNMYFGTEKKGIITLKK